MKNDKILRKLISITLALVLVVGFMPIVRVSSTEANSISDLDFTMIDGGYGHTFAIKADGSLWAWGTNAYGQLGNGTTEDQLTPIKVMTNVVSISSSYGGSIMAIKTDGSLWAWGYNQYGQLGDGTTTDRATPIQILDNVQKIIANGSDSYALKTDGSLWACGQMLDYNPIIDYGKEFTKLLEDVKDIVPGERHCFAIKTDDTLWGWGADYGNMFTGSTADTWNPEYNLSPRQVLEGVKTVFTYGITNTVVVKTDGTVVFSDSSLEGLISDFVDLNNIVDIIVTDYVYYIESDNTLWRFNPRVNFEGRYNPPTKLIEDVKTFVNGYKYSMVIKNDNTLWTWGNNDYGQLGDGTTMGSNDPIKIMDDVTLCRSISERSTYILKKDESLWACGDNEFGQLGDGTTEDRATPVKIMDGVKLPNSEPDKSVTATPTSHKIIVNDEEITFDAYNIEGNNYFKLRDLAYILSGTEKQFEVFWDESNNAILLTSSEPYTIVGGEMVGKGEDVKTSMSTTAKIYVDGVEVSFTAYHIEGNNYFKLRDIGQAFDFGITWDCGSECVMIDTTSSYLPE